MFAVDDNDMSWSMVLPNDIVACPRLQSFSASNVNMDGISPNFFGNASLFPDLESLSLDRNQLWGAIRPDFGINSKIKFLDVGAQHLVRASASIVASRAGLDGVLREPDLGSLSFLEELDLSFNSLTTPTGGLPLLPTPLQHLHALDLRSNRLIDIPEGFFAGFPALETVAIDDNPMAAPELRLDVLTGSAGLRSFSANNIGLLIFPDYFGNALVFPAVETLSLARNEMSGRIPPSFGNNSRIKYLDISGQIDSSEGIRLLVGRIDHFIPGMKSLVEVRMDRNGFVGPLPDTTKLANLRVFSAADNNLCGVPSSPAVSLSTLRKPTRWHAMLALSYLYLFFVFSLLRKFFLSRDSVLFYTFIQYSYFLPLLASIFLFGLNNKNI
jgi:hypothetical protein